MTDTFTELALLLVIAAAAGALAVRDAVDFAAENILSIVRRSTNQG
jgi:hypothetical protein